MLKSLCALGQQSVSRQKTLLKRRKIHLKKRPVSKKVLAEEAKHVNYSREYKALQIQKQLDRCTHPSHHLNELMDDIFYPDLAKSDSQVADARMQSVVSKDIHFGVEYRDELEELLDEHFLPADLLDTAFKQNKEEFEAHHYQVLVKKLDYYFRNRDNIKKKLQSAWAAMNANLQKREKRYQVRKCPYLFLERQDLHHYRPWSAFADHLAQRIASCSHQEVGEYAQVLLKINSMMGGIASILYRSYCVLLEHELQQQTVHQLSLKSKVNSIMVYTLKKKQLFPVYNVIDVEEGETKELDEAGRICLQFCKDILADGECSSYDLANIFKAFRFSILPLEGPLREIIQIPILRVLSETPIQKVIDYFEVFMRNQEDPASQSEFVEILKFDIVRKLPSIVSKTHLMKCIQLSSGARRSQSTQALFRNCVETVGSKYCGANSLTTEQAKTVIENCFRSNYRHQNMLELMLSELLRNRKELSLGSLTHCVMKIMLLGYESVTAANVLMKQFEQRYQEDKERARKAQNLMLTDKNTELINMGSKSISLGQIELEEDLICAIWVLVEATSRAQSNALNKHQRTKINIDQLLKVYPLSITSTNPIVRSYIHHIYEALKPLSTFWIIKSPISLEGLPDTKRFSDYIEFSRQDQMGLVLWKESEQSGIYEEGINIETKQHLPLPWIKTNYFSAARYAAWLQQQHPNLYFNTSKRASPELLECRQRLIKVWQSRAGNSKRPDNQQTQQTYQLD